MKEQFKEIYQKATENNWSAEQLEEALKEAGMMAEDLAGTEELDLEQMASVAGGEGADPATCAHKTIGRWPKYNISPGKNDYGYQVKVTSYCFKCWSCGQRWTGTSETFDFIPGWKGTIFNV